MPEGYSVEVHGYPELAAGTAKLASNIERASRDAFLHVADQAAALLRSRLHVDTGATVASVLARGEDRGSSLSMGEGVPYAQFQEYGGRGWPHSPTGNFLYPVTESVESVLVSTAERTATQEIGAMRWPNP